ncbi:1-acyl-sn-glycerol-3-phosphate acyltransferase [Sagittula sp. MA-2]|jgi:1-acyl-sn-glycerol-3-phosphate acyltransferase|uniref:lysophospholipid acyltransferase family protein n=1 Tax=Sagittula sp. MA-2 TaxID=3048007 RepID=UPI0024C422E8|nr:lysophospholipid acyltransferase family protein [Sagittula sp. MA-2]WHZ37488.1 lysophospholipid acyltransferase family protein [Sagittula sp. MA-2]
MSYTWEGEEPPAHPPFTLSERLRVAWRGIPIALVLVTGLLLMMFLRLIERPLHGMDRPWTPHITRVVCRIVLRIMGLRVRASGSPPAPCGALVANHSSWLDIFVLNSRWPVYFVSKAEVAGWPGIGLLARATGTVFITRDRRDAAAQTALFRERLAHGHRLLFFPEGTSTDGLRVLTFRTPLFAAFFDEDLVHEVSVQAVSLAYHAPEGADPRFYGWWGGMDFAPSLARVLAQRRQGSVDLICHAPVRVDDYANRKSLAHALETQVRAGHERALSRKG